MTGMGKNLSVGHLVCHFWLHGHCTGLLCPCQFSEQEYWSGKSSSPRDIRPRVQTQVSLHACRCVPVGEGHQEAHDLSGRPIWQLSVITGTHVKANTVWSQRTFRKMQICTYLLQMMIGSVPSTCSILSENYTIYITSQKSLEVTVYLEESLLSISESQKFVLFVCLLQSPR